ncbi:MAG: desulfoferrodoxin family protein [Elusimicrobiota bacterium]
MKAHVCGVCGYIVLSGDVPDNCPVCYSPKEKFAEKEDAIKQPQDAGSLSELEKKHIPQITVAKACNLIDGCHDVHARMGEIVHPMLAEHYITSIDFYLDKQFLARVHLTPEKLNPAAALHLKADTGNISVVSHCNIHGSWMSETEL